MANSSYTSHDITRLAGPRLGASHVLNPAVDGELFTPNVDASAVIKRHALTGKRTLLTVSRLTKKKGHDLVLRAMPNVLEHVPEAAYLIVGSGPEEENLRLLCSRLGIASHVVFAGSVDHQQLPQYYCSCSAFVMPSREVASNGDFESFGIAFLEASACGKPVIGCRTGGIADAVLDGVTGILVQPDNVDALANALSSLLQDPGKARDLGCNGRQRAVAEFSWDRVGEQITSVLHSVQTGEAPRPLGRLP